MSTQQKEYVFFDPDIRLSALARHDPRQVRRLVSRGPKNFYPLALYKYRSVGSDVDVARLRTILVDSEFYLSSRKQFNDPFDATAVPFVTSNGPKRMRWAHDLAKGQNVTYKDRKRFVKQMTDPAFAERRALFTLNSNLDSSGVFSFAGDPRDILMWSHYASSHNGICLRFEIALDADTFLHALAVQYSEQFPVIDWISTDYAQNTIRALLTKSPHWLYERERRFVVTNGAGKFLPFLPQALTHVIYGCKVTPSTVDAVRSVLSERYAAGRPRVKELYAHQSRERFSLGIFSAPARPNEWRGRATWPPTLTQPPI